MIAFAALLFALFLIDRASLFLPPCGPYEQHGNASDEDSNDEYCAKREGIVVAGVEALGSLKPEWWTAAATVVICAFTVLLAYATVGLQRLGGQQARTMRQSMRISARAARAAQASADAASEAVALSDKTSLHQLRAYIGVVGGRIQMDMQDRLHISLEAMNRVQTPARDVEYWIDAEVRASDARQPGPALTKLSMKWTMAPGAMWTLRCLPIEVGTPTAEDIRWGKRQLIIWGAITYRDVFQPETERKSTFCYSRGVALSLRPDAIPPRTKWIWEIDPCESGNEST